jgi:hypothetical protein
VRDVQERRGVEMRDFREAVMRMVAIVRVMAMAGSVMACADGAAGTGPLVVEAISLTPGTAVLVVGQSVQFAVTGQLADGGSITPAVSYSATGGTISSSGLYVAGTVQGDFHVIASHAESGLADTAAVTVAASLPPGTILVQEGFEDNNAAARGWYDNVAAWTTTTAEHRPTGSRSLEWTWAAGAILPTFGGAARHEFAATPQVYVSYWVKYSSNWMGSGVAYHPHEFYLLTNANGRYTGPSFTHLTTYIEHLYGPTGGIPRIGTSDGANIDVTRVGQDLSTVTEARATAGCNGNTDGYSTDCYSLGGGRYNNGKWLLPAGLGPAFLPEPGPGYKGDWHHVEVFFRMNTIVNGIGQSDGVAQYWFDGQLLIDQHDVLFRTGQHPDLQWTQFLIGPYIGVGSPVAQSAWIDDLLIATTRP